MIWQKNLTLEQMNQLSANSAVSHLGIQFCAQGDNWLEATMPVDQRTIQPMGFLHGGISVALAETLGSMAGFCCVKGNQAVVGLEINANHLRPEPFNPQQIRQVIGRATLVHLGKQTQVWQIEIKNEQGKLCTLSRLTLSVIHHEQN